MDAVAALYVRREDTSYVYVDVGLGFYPAMTFDEAREFCKQKEALLAK